MNQACHLQLLCQTTSMYFVYMTSKILTISLTFASGFFSLETINIQCNALKHFTQGLYINKLLLDDIHPPICTTLLSLLMSCFY